MGSKETEEAMALPKPRLSVYSFADPRNPTRHVPIVAFYYPGRAERWDTACQSGFLGNFFPQPTGESIAFAPPGFPETQHTFSNAEAAFQALKFWKYASDFEKSSGDQAFRLKRKWNGHEDWSYAGFGSNWAGMMNVLHSKY